MLVAPVPSDKIGSVLLPELSWVDADKLEVLEVAIFKMLLQ
jgi:hypothetical protein